MLLNVPGVRWAVQRVFRAQRSLTLGVRALVVDADSRVMLVRHGYAPGWHFPGGGVEKGESLLSAVTRETREETGIELTAAPQLFGIYTNFDAFPGDHVALFVVRSFTRVASPKPSFEIRDHDFHPREALPADTTSGTRRRMTEVFESRPPAEAW